MHNVVGEATIMIDTDYLGGLLTDASIVNEEITVNQFVLVKDVSVDDNGIVMATCDICERLYN